MKRRFRRQLTIGLVSLIGLACPLAHKPIEPPEEPSPFITNEQEIKDRFIDGKTEQVNVSGALDYDPLNPLTKHLRGDLDNTLKQLNWARAVYLKEGDSLEQISTIANAYTDPTIFYLGQGEFNLEQAIMLYPPVSIVGEGTDNTTVNASFIGLDYLGIKGVHTKGNDKHNLGEDIAPFFLVGFGDTELLNCYLTNNALVGLNSSNQNILEGNSFVNILEDYVGEGVEGGVAVTYELGDKNSVENNTLIRSNHFKDQQNVFYLEDTLTTGTDNGYNLFENCGTVVYNEEGEQDFTNNAWLGGTSNE